MKLNSHIFKPPSLAMGECLMCALIDWQRVMMWLAIVTYVATCALRDEIADWAVVLILTAAVSVAMYAVLTAIGVGI